jgi:hypothetical protein
MFSSSHDNIHHGLAATLSVFGNQNTDQGTRSTFLRDPSPEKIQQWDPDPIELKLYKSAQTIEKLQRSLREKGKKAGNIK